MTFLIVVGWAGRLAVVVDQRAHLEIRLADRRGEVANAHASGNAQPIADKMDVLAGFLIVIALVDERRRQAVRRVPHGNHSPAHNLRSEEHTSELQSLMRISYAVFCLKKKQTNTQTITNLNTKHN